MRLFKKILTSLAWVLLFVYLSVMMLPKEALFFKAEELLQPFKIYLNESGSSDRLLAFELQDTTLLYQDIEAAKIDRIRLVTLLFYNRLSVTPFTVKEDLAAFVPPGIEALSLTHHLFMPHRVALYAKGDFGEAEGFVDFYTRRVYLDITFDAVVNRNHRALLQMVKKNEQGYYYEYAF
jgi:hypothetical protein